MSASETVAVVGSGVAGMVAAHAATRAGARVTLFEAAPRAGGHADTSLVTEGDRTLAIDTGFIVHNRVTYPVLCRVYAELGVLTQESEMSMSVADEVTGLEWAGARGLSGVFPTWRHAVSPAYLRMLVEIPRFHRSARRLLTDQSGGADQTLAEFVAETGLSPYFMRHMLEPLVAAVWSCDPAVAGRYPARYLFEFLAHHGMLSVFGSPAWRTVTGGSVQYVDKILAELDEVCLGCPVESVLEGEDGVEVVAEGHRRRTFDRVVIATHPAQALGVLAAPTPLQKELLSALEYSDNEIVLHTDTSVMPHNQRTWSSWNFRRPRTDAGHVRVTYDLTRLQRLDTDTHYLVTLGGTDLIDPDQVIATRHYSHPLYTPETVTAQSQLPLINTDRISFAGAYHGWGFHEDGARSGAGAVARFGLHWPESSPESSAPVAQPPRVYATTVSHVREKPWRRQFAHSSYLGVVDVPDAATAITGAGGSVESRDHLGDPDVPLRENLRHFLAARDVELGDARVQLAAHPRAFGHCFNPISVWWCTHADRTPLATVVEVHNTYGDRHAYLIQPDADGSVGVAKQMYVSPFFGTDGHYQVHAPVPDDVIDIRVSLHTDDGGTFVARLSGHRIEGHRLRAAASGLLDSVRIRWHGIRIWLRRLPIQPRPTHHQEEVQ